ncbi:MAG: CCA tRNA nucleotidyltransferase [Candidatus Omnitrophota bacterium]|nr:CCA tRNA nucleotidyltransferase [Candidatus Omnitrophota bacterium]
MIKTVGKIADEMGVGAYLVGGPVRDKLLGRANCDLDFVIEGSGISFAEILNKKLKGRLTAYRAFGTATIQLKGKRVDIVTARKESYKHPAAYPDVTTGTIKDDLFRRDFTINAMAMALNKKNFGKLVDFYGGEKDLKRRVIRALHDKSFMDDPTRIFRAVRFSVRFGFKIEPHTKKLIKEALLGGFLGEVNKGRIKKEIELFLKEKDPGKCLKAFGKLI